MKELFGHNNTDYDFMMLNRKFVNKFKLNDEVHSPVFGKGKVIEVRSWIINDFPIRVIFEKDSVSERGFSLKGQYMMAGPSDKDLL